MTPRYTLVDDGTLDIVIHCAQCGADIRFAPFETHRDACSCDETIDCRCYAAHIDDCLAIMADDHECASR